MNPKIILATVLITALLSACSVLAPEPAPTPTLEPTAVPANTTTPTISPTPTPSPADLLLEGWQAYHSGDLDTARQIAEEVRQHFPEDYHPYALLIAVEAQQNDLNSIIEQLEIEVGNNSQDAGTIQMLSQAYLLLASQIRDEIYTCYTYSELYDLIYLGRDILERQQALGLDADPVTETLYAWFNLGMEYAGTGFNPDTPGYSYWLRATEHAHNLDYEAAIQEMELAIINDPKMENLYKITAEYYLEMEDFPNAIDYYKTVLGITPGLYEQWVDLAIVYIYLGLPIHAQEALIGTMRSYPEFDYAEDAYQIYLLNFTSYDDTKFLDYGFRLALPTDGEVDDTPDLINNSPEEGLVTFANDYMAVNLVWLPLSDFAYGPNYDPLEVLAEIPETFTDLGSTTILSDPLLFEYNQVPITYRAFIIGPNEIIDATSLAAQAIWQCDSTVFILQQIISYDYSNTLYQFNPFLESITCGVERIETGLP